MCAMTRTRAALLAAVLAFTVAGCTPAEKPEAREPAPRATVEREPTPEPEPVEVVEEPEPVAEEPTPAPEPDPTQALVDAVQAQDWVTYCNLMADASVSGYDVATVGAERVAELRTIFYDACLENVG